MSNEIDASPECAARVKKNSDRAFKRFTRTGVPRNRISTTLKRLESLLYWYRCTIETSPEVLVMLKQVDEDIKYYSDQERNHTLEKEDDEWTPPEREKPIKANPRYDYTFYPSGAKRIHITKECNFGAARAESTVTSLCGKVYTQWRWAEHIDKDYCPACLRIEKESENKV